MHAFVSGPTSGRHGLVCTFTTNSAKARARAIRSRCMLRITLLASRRVDVTRVHWRRMLKYFYYSAIALSPSQWPAGRPDSVIRLIYRNTDCFRTRTAAQRWPCRSISHSNLQAMPSISLAKTRYHRNPLL